MNEVSTPMNVQINGGAVLNGILNGDIGAVFDNVGGSLTVTDFEASNVMAVSLIDTSNGGVSSLSITRISRVAH
jgi:hypothetical protein